LVILIRRVVIAAVPFFALAAGGAFAQTNTSTVLQNGSQNTAVIDQALNSGTSNEAMIDQGVGGNGLASVSGQAEITQIGGSASHITSNIVQNGSEHYARTYQNASFGGTQSSSVTQKNTRNSAIVNQYTSAALDNQQSTVTQEGTGAATHWNSVIVNQYGPRDFSTVYQTGTGNDGATSSAVVLGTPGHGPTYNVATGINIQQEAFSTNWSTANQYVNYSGIDVFQRSGDATGGTNLSTANQYGGGSYNFLGVQQESSAGGSNTSIINQNSGSYNAAYSGQLGTSGSILYSEITQSGSNNLTQLWQTPTSSASYERSYITQTGQNGYIHNEQDGTNDYAFSYQAGQNSDGHGYSPTMHVGPISAAMETGISIFQQGTTANSATVYQYSNESGVGINQQGSSGTNTAYVYQYGNGSGDFAATLQVADGGGVNLSTITQNANGSGNLAGVVQQASAGVTNRSVITQTGNNNSAMVYQHH
jgi:hypothetical protein